MDENQVEGAFKTATGRVQDAAGALAGDPGMQAEGKFRQASGRVQAGLGDAVHEVSHRIEEQPMVALMIAGAVGFALGVLVGRR